jgi:D-lactate dehydrogenase
VRIAFFSAKAYDRQSFERVNAAHGHELTFLEERLEAATVGLARGFPVACVFVNDTIDAAVLDALAAGGTRLVALRCTGFNNVDLAAAARLGVAVARVTEYSPFSVAEFAVGLMLALNRRLHRAYTRTRDHNFSLDGLMGFDLHGRTVGVIGTGKIGRIVARITGGGFGCRVVAHDPSPDPGLAAAGVTYLDPQALAAEADILTLHCPLTPATRHIVSARSIAAAKPGLLLVNTGRGGLVDTAALIDGLVAGRIGGAALDVYEQEEGIFVEDHSDRILDDRLLPQLLGFPNVIVTSHQGFLTAEALADIAATTLGSVSDLAAGRPLAHALRAG